ncbi:MAG: NTP transferase domain-containing protein [Bacteroidales bacterium]|jgi:NDP-sugar pyrophosphorylase family protein|nr:NTP transferase domain-containing protein [Bacteroidales bacterium]
MNYAILSAGTGSRLKSEMIEVPKPLVKVDGIPMIERLLSVFLENNAEKIYVITNLQPETMDFLRKKQSKMKNKLEIIFKETPSSAHSFYELFPYLYDKSFCLTTVDTIFNPDEFTSYIKEFTSDKMIDGLLAVTSFIDDESPLYIETDENMNITGFHDQNNGKCKYISGGIYAFNPSVSPTIKRASEKGITRMRNLQRELLANNLKLKAYPFSKILDIDHAADIEKGKEFLEKLKTEN